MYIGNLIYRVKISTKKTYGKLQNDTKKPILGRLDMIRSVIWYVY